MTTMLTNEREITAANTIEVLKEHILVDGFHLVLDAQASHGAYLHDAASGEEYLDFYSFYASQPISYNHPRMREPAFLARLLNAAALKVANPDVYTRAYAEFVATVADVVGLPPLDKYFFIDGGALAIENALKTAFDWKVRKNIAAGRGEGLGTQVLHFRHAFHGRSGYTMSLTNTDPVKVMHFPKFNWPRVDSPFIDYSLPEADRDADAAARERETVRQIEQAVAQHGHDLAALIIEPIQGEGGDNHFRGEFLRALRELCDRHEMLLIFDEVQSGMGLTGRNWCCEHFDVLPDILAFGKKMQICGIMAGPRIDDVDNVFKVPSRINSTFGGNLTDMVRATQYLRIIDDERLVDRAADTGAHLLDGLQRLAERNACVTAPRGRGLLCAFDLPDAATRNAFRTLCQQRRLLVLACGERSIRFRPVLDIDRADVDRGLELIEDALRELDAGCRTSGAAGASE